MNPNLPFLVYGTLRAGQPNSHLLRDGFHGLRSAETVRVPGYALFAGGRDPFPWAAAEMSGNLVAECFQPFEHRAHALMRAVDILEGYRASNEARSMYLRRVVPFVREDGTTDSGWLYIAASVEAYYLPRVADDDWATHDSWIESQPWRSSSLGDATSGDDA